jgi:hypothetical protein
MTLTDPREALADQSSFIDYLMGMVGLAQVVRALAASGAYDVGTRRDTDDLVHVLLGLASLGEAIERLAELAAIQGKAETSPMPATAERWLR